MTEAAREDTGKCCRRALRLEAATALLLFAAATALLFGDVFRAGFDRVVASRPELAEHTLSQADLRFAVWATARNAYTFARRPAHLFDAEPCHPAERTLALGHPILSLGLLGAPLALLGAEPVTIYNAVVVALPILAAFAMFLLVRDLTGLAGAGIVAGLCFACLPLRASAVTYPYCIDLSWTVLGLFFGRRLFEGARFRDAIGAAVCATLQIATSLYTAVAGLALGLPLLLWLVLRYGATRLREPAVALGFLLAGIGGFAVLAPYVVSSAGTNLSRRLVFADASELLGDNGESLLLLGLALVGLLLPRGLRPDRRVGDPRLALIAAGVLTTALATDALGIYTALARSVPGMAARVPGFVLQGTHAALCIAAGLGVSALLRLVPVRRRTLVTALAVGVVFVDVLRPSVLGLAPRVVYRSFAVRPPAEALAFFEALREGGNDGPLLELPIDYHNAGYTVRQASEHVLLAAYHHRRTSSCYNSVLPVGAVELEGLSRRLPDAKALDELRALGFTTVVVNRAAGLAWARLLERHAATGPLRWIHSSRERIAFEIGRGPP